MVRNIILWLCVSCSLAAGAQTDTLRVMGYNVLYYGSGCQGPNGYYHNYLKTIAGYVNPDIISLEKMASVPLSADDKYGTAPLGFADSILTYALNAAFPGRYAYCPFTNGAKANNMCMLFYDKNKLGFVNITSSYANITDFNTYKLYYKDATLATTHDTIFLYVTLNHDKSGDENVQVRGQQIEQEMYYIKKHFSHLPNMINIGDFNVRGCMESCYQTITACPDTNYVFYDPPFFPDHDLSYPVDWDHEPKFAAYFTTSTRESDEAPNPCGSGGGAKNWYDHIFLSSWIINGVNRIRYIPHSYRTIGNDGHRFRVSINNNNTYPNQSTPPDVINALYHMSNKYPVMACLAVDKSKSNVRPADPEIISGTTYYKEQILLDSAVSGRLFLHVPSSLLGQEVTVECIDAAGNLKMKRGFKLASTQMMVKCKLQPGSYRAQFYTAHNFISDAQFRIE